MKSLEEYNVTTMIPLSREIAKFLYLLKFRQEDSVISLKDVKVVLKAPYELLTD